MRRGVVSVPDPRLRRRTVKTLPDELRVRGVQVLSSFRERIGLAISGGGYEVARSPRGVVSTLRGDPSRTIADARRRFAEGITPGLRRLSATVGALRRAAPDAETSVRCRADRAVDGTFDLLGHRNVSFGDPIDWHRDPQSGIRAPMRHWSRIQYLDPATVGDYKLLWEVNRHQHFVMLGQAYAFSQDSRYADAFVAQLSSWIAANPPRLGVNWASSLEVSYRAISWLWALQLFAEAPQLTDAILATALESLRRHGKHIERYLSTYYSPNTHLTGEALGLLYLGTALPIFEAADSWRQLGWSILRDQLFRQARPDGSYFEQALYYHRYTADIYHHALVLADANGWARDDEMRERVERLDDFLVHAVHPDGTVPLVGDDDGGRLIRLDGLPTRDARPTLTTGAALFKRGDMRLVGGAAIEECLWLLGVEGSQALSSVRAQAPSEGSRGFPEGGFYVLRDGWSPSATWALVDGGPHGSLNCGHAHADALAVEVAATRPSGADRQRHVQLHGRGARALPGLGIAQYGDRRRRELVADRRVVPLATRGADDRTRVVVRPGRRLLARLARRLHAACRSGGARAEPPARAWTLSRRARRAARIGRTRAHRALALRAGSGVRAGGDARRRDRASGAHRWRAAPALRAG